MFSLFALSLSSNSDCNLQLESFNYDTFKSGCLLVIDLVDFAHELNCEIIIDVDVDQFWVMCKFLNPQISLSLLSELQHWILNTIHRYSVAYWLKRESHFIPKKSVNFLDFNWQHVPKSYLLMYICWNSLAPKTTTKISWKTKWCLLCSWFTNCCMLLL